MNEMTPLETRLRSWTPRRPSPALKQSLFGSTPAIERRTAPRWGWLAPATVCLLLAFATLSQLDDSLIRVARTPAPGPMIALTLSNVSLSAYFPGSFANRHNSVPVDSFEWTNPLSSRSSIPSFSRAETNFLKR